jgi:hypothetical protein
MSEWEDGKPRKVALPVKFASQTVHHGESEAHHNNYVCVHWWDMSCPRHGYISGCRIDPAASG